MTAPGFQPPEIEELQELLPAYEILFFIAAGGMGAVYHARQKSLDREVAIKILPREYGADEDFRKQFESEAKAMAKLNDANLIGVYDFGEVDGMPYLVMEYVDGKSLHHSAHGKAIEQKAAAEIALGIAEGLAHAHEAGILHRDIKPANILLNSDAKPKIGDFGLARPAESDETDAVVFGTPGYTAPEVLKNPETVAKQSDVYSLGVILYELLTGELPGGTYVPASSKCGSDPRFDQMIRRATHPSPTLRFADAGAFAAQLRDLVEKLSKPQAASILTSLPAGQGEDGQSPAEPRPTAPVPQVAMSPSSNWTFLRNIVIIVILLGAIYGVIKAIQWKQATTARKEREHKEKLENGGTPLETPIMPERPVAVTPTEREEPTPTEPEEPAPETPLEALERLQDALVSGDRNEFPPGTHERGPFRYFLVESPMCWSAAAQFAEEHGGYLATCPSNTDRGWLSSKLPSNSDAWLGGGATGRNQWGWIDDAEWTLKKPSTLTGSVVALSDLGTVRSKPAGTQLPFVIQWNMDGSNPATLAKQLERTRETLSSPNPAWPPGSVHNDSRHFLLVHRALPQRDAEELAEDIEGHLAVPSDEQENAFLRQMLTDSLPEGASCWIGGVHNGRSWGWTTGEPWSFTDWKPGSPNGSPAKQDALRFIAGSEGGWDDAVAKWPEATEAFLIEWSTDKDRKPQVSPASASGDLLRLQQIARTEFLKDRAAYERALADNSKDLKWDLDFWLRGLPGSQRNVYADSIETMKNLVPDKGPIPEDIPRSNMPVKIANILEDKLQKQVTIEEDYLGELDKLRQAYLTQLTKKTAELHEAGKESEKMVLENEIQAIGQDGASFRDHFEATE